ncbi:unnamed protein product, partial [marine sediment metagenome]
MDEIKQPKPKKPMFPLRRIIVFALVVIALACLALYWQTKDPAILVIAGTIVGTFAQMLT